MTASLRVKNDKYYVVLTHTTDGKKNQTWVSTGLSVTGNEGKARQLMLDMLGEKPEQAAPPDMLFSDAVRRCQVLDRRMKSERGMDSEGELKLFLVELAGAK